MTKEQLNDTEETLNEQKENKTEQAENMAEQPENTADAETEENGDNVETPVQKEPTAEEQIAELNDKYLRKLAEFENYRKRTMKEKADLILNGAARTVEAFLPVIDDMERAIDNAAKSDDIEAVREGINMIFQKFEKTLSSLGVKKIETKDADFNTDFHEAIAMVPGMGDDKKNKVIDCVQTGYILNDKVIRHAKVAVGQ
ncbi:MAG: nucleotide exchange factor GrpE [Bacteroidaceae bacterium]|nr:nucleotide exchange factor GrpE [Bacteroidaceae bacterium]